MTLFAPYYYIWGINSSLYKLNTLMDGYNTLGLRAVSLAFVTGKSNGKNTFNDFGYKSINDIKEFISKNGTVILSFGGPKGPHLSDVALEEDEYQQMYKILDDTGIRFINYDIGGRYISDISGNTKRNGILKRLQATFTDLKVMFTLSTEMPSLRSSGGLTQSGINIIIKALEAGVMLNYINLKTMDYYAILPPNKTWGVIACDIVTSVKNQLQKLFPKKSDRELYSTIGMTPMIGVNNDNTIFTLEDAQTVANFVKENGIGFLSCWSFQRDQAGKGDLLSYSQINKTDYEYYNIFSQVTLEQKVTTPQKQETQSQPLIETPGLEQLQASPSGKEQKESMSDVQKSPIVVSVQQPPPKRIQILLDISFL